MPRTFLKVLFFALLLSKDEAALQGNFEVTDDYSFPSRSQVELRQLVGLKAQSEAQLEPVINSRV